MNLMIKGSLAPVFVGVAAMLAVACDSTSEPTSPVGFYALASMNGDGVPATMFEAEGYSLQVIHGTMDVVGDFTFIVAITTLETVDVNQSEYVDSLRGTWTLDAMNAMQFNMTDYEPPTFPGSWQGNHLTILLADGSASNSFIFQRTR
jgi:hypothetical protein